MIQDFSISDDSKLLEPKGVGGGGGVKRYIVQEHHQQSEVPSSCLTFLGIEMDTVAWSCPTFLPLSHFRLPQTLQRFWSWSRWCSS